MNPWALDDSCYSLSNVNYTSTETCGHYNLITARDKNSYEVFLLYTFLLLVNKASCVAFALQDSTTTQFHSLEELKKHIAQLDLLVETDFQVQWTIIASGGPGSFYTLVVLLIPSAQFSTSMFSIHLMCSLKCLDNKTPSGAAEQQSVNYRAEAPHPAWAWVPGPSSKVTQLQLSHISLHGCVWLLFLCVLGGQWSDLVYIGRFPVNSKVSEQLWCQTTGKFCICLGICLSQVNYEWII